MRIEPRQPDPSVNVSKSHVLAEASTLVAGLVAIFAVATVAIVFAVDVAMRFVPPAKEVQWFSAWSPFEINVEETAQRQRLAALLDRLSRHMDSDYTFRIAVDDSDQLNAMALPGGLITVTQGLLDAVESENELAFVLGHELGHFADRDHLRRLGRVAAVGLLLSIVSTSGAGDVGFGVSDLTLRSFSRNQEADADAFGLQVLNEEYGHVAEAGAFFARIGGFSSVFDRYVGTHPWSEDRADALIGLARARGFATDGPVSPWDVDHEGPAP